MNSAVDRTVRNNLLTGRPTNAQATILQAAFDAECKAFSPAVLQRAFADCGVAPVDLALQRRRLESAVAAAASAPTSVVEMAVAAAASVLGQAKNASPVPATKVRLTTRTLFSADQIVAAAEAQELATATKKEGKAKRKREKVMGGGRVFVAY